MPVSTIALPLAGTTVSLALYRSYPAAKAEPRVGILADFLSFLTRRGGSGCEREVTAVPSEALLAMVEAIEGASSRLGFVLLGSGEAGKDGGSWLMELFAGAAVVDILVRGGVVS